MGWFDDLVSLTPVGVVINAAGNILHVAENVTGVGQAPNSNDVAYKAKYIDAPEIQTINFDIFTWKNKGNIGTAMVGGVLNPLIRKLRYYCTNTLKGANYAETLAQAGNPDNYDAIIKACSKYGFELDTAHGGDMADQLNSQMSLLTYAVDLYCTLPLPKPTANTFDSCVILSSLTEELKNRNAQLRAAYIMGGTTFDLKYGVLTAYSNEISSKYQGAACDIVIKKGNTADQLNTINQATSSAVADTAAGTGSKNTTYIIYAIAALVVVAILIKIFK